MSLCKLMQLDFKGQLTGFTPEEAYDEYDLQFGIAYCDGWLAEGMTRDEIGDFDLAQFRGWCIQGLKERKEQ